MQTHSTTERVTHTPGPWLADPISPDAHADPEMGIDEDELVWIAEDRVAGQVLATVHRMGQSAEANARLIAAAPDLLAALKVAQREIRHSERCADSIDRGAWGCSCGYMRAYDQIDAAIKKAEGAA